MEKRHNLLKKFLVEILDIDESLAEHESENLAHSISCHTTAKLQNYIESIFNKLE